MKGTSADTGNENEPLSFNFFTFNFSTLLPYCLPLWIISTFWWSPWWQSSFNPHESIAWTRFQDGSCGSLTPCDKTD